MWYWLLEMVCWYVLEKLGDFGEVDVYVCYCDYYMVLVVLFNIFVDNDY